MVPANAAGARFPEAIGVHLIDPNRPKKLSLGRAQQFCYSKMRVAEMFSGCFHGGSMRFKKSFQALLLCTGMTLAMGAGFDACVKVTKDGAGGGTVTSATGGINCGTSCVESFTTGAEVTLTARPDAYSMFLGWLQSCSGINPTCTFPAAGTKEVAAAFFPFSMSAGYDHTCSVFGGGDIECWGNNQFLQSDPPAGGFKQVSSGAYFSCALKADGSIACWGKNEEGQSSAPPGNNFVQISAGLMHACAVKNDGGLHCWGYRGYGLLAAPRETTFVQVSSGDRHNCGLKADGNVACWGDSVGGNTPPPAGPFVQISASRGGFTCGVRNDGRINCWGALRSGLDNPPNETFVQVTTGQHFACGVKSNGNIACWGHGQDYLETTPPSGSIGVLTAGLTHICGITSNLDITCWGNNDVGQASPPGAFEQVTGGMFHSCGLKRNGHINCWGNNNYGQLNAFGGRYKEISAGNFHTCGRKEDGRVICWGANAASDAHLYPVGDPRRDDPNFGQVGLRSGFYSQVSAGTFRNCGVKTDGSLDCWGDSTMHPAGNDFKQVSVSSKGGTNCGLKNDGSLVCWMRGFSSNSCGPECAFLQVPGERTFTQVSVGDYHACGLKIDGTIACWGGTVDSGDVPNGPPDGASAYVQVVSNRRDHSCGLTNDGRAVCWGKPEAAGGSWVAAPDASAHHFAQLGMGTLHACGVDNSGIIACWGYNSYGQASPSPRLMKFRPPFSSVLDGIFSHL